MSGCMLSTGTPAKTELRCVLLLTINRHCQTEQKCLWENICEKMWEMLLSYSIWHTFNCIHTQQGFLLHRVYLTRSTSNRDTAAVTRSTRQEREADRIMLGFPQPFISKDCFRRGYPEECSHSPLRLPGCHHVTVSVWSESLMWLPIPATHTMSQPKKCILCCGFAPETATPGQEPGEGRGEGLPHISSSRNVLNEAFVSNKSIFLLECCFMGLLAAVFSHRALASGAFMCFMCFSFLLQIPPAPPGLM